MSVEHYGKSHTAWVFTLTYRNRCMPMLLLALCGRNSGGLANLGPMSMPTHRLLRKSAPRGKSPDPKALKKASLVTPPPNASKVSSRSSSATKSDSCKKQLSFGDDSVHPIQAENPPGAKVKSTTTDEILSALKQEPMTNERCQFYLPRFHIFFVRSPLHTLR